MAELPAVDPELCSEVHEALTEHASGIATSTDRLERVLALDGAHAALARIALDSKRSHSSVRSLAASSLARAPSIADAALSTVVQSLPSLDFDANAPIRLHLLACISRSARACFPHKWHDPVRDCIAAAETAFSELGQSGTSAVSACATSLKALASRRLPADRRAVQSLAETHGQSLVQLAHSSLPLRSQEAQPQTHAARYRAACKGARRAIELSGSRSACSACVSALELVQHAINNGVDDVEVAAGTRKLLQCVPVVAHFSSELYASRVAPTAVDVCWHALAMSSKVVNSECTGVALRALACTPEAAAASPAAAAAVTANDKSTSASPAEVLCWLVARMLPMSEELVEEWCSSATGETFFGSQAGAEEPLNARVRPAAIVLLTALGSWAPRECAATVANACLQTNAESDPGFTEAAFTAASTFGSAVITGDAAGTVAHAACAELQRSASDDSTSSVSVYKLLCTRAALLAIASIAKSLDDGTLAVCMQRCADCAVTVGQKKPECSRCALLAMESIFMCRNDLVPPTQAVVASISAGCECKAEVDAVSILLDAVTSLVQCVGGEVLVDDEVVRSMMTLWNFWDDTGRVQVLTLVDGLMRACGKSVSSKNMCEFALTLVCESLQHAAENSDVLVDCAVPLCEQILCRMPLEHLASNSLLQCVQFSVAYLSSLLSSQERSNAVDTYVAAAEAIGHAAALGPRVLAIDESVNALEHVTQALHVNQDLIFSEAALAKSLSDALDALAVNVIKTGAQKQEHYRRRVDCALQYAFVIVAQSCDERKTLNGKAIARVLCTIGRVMLTRDSGQRVLQSMGLASESEAFTLASLAAWRFDDVRSAALKRLLAVVLAETLSLRHTYLLNLLPEAVALCTSCVQHAAYNEPADEAPHATIGAERKKALLPHPDEVVQPILLLQRVQEQHREQFNVAWSQLDSKLQQDANTALEDVQNAQRKHLCVEE